MERLRNLFWKAVLRFLKIALHFRDPYFVICELLINNKKYNFTFIFDGSFVKNRNLIWKTGVNFLSSLH